ncbi:hypothetical protein IJT10_04635 [bacterium]|nr:hypothetical protein [bacterium]
MKRLSLFIFILCLFIVGQFSLAAEVVMGGRVIFEIKNEEQAQRISQRIESLLQSGASPEKIKVVRKEVVLKKSGDKDKGKKSTVFSIYWGKDLIVDVTHDMAVKAGGTAESVAHKWADTLRSVAEIGLFNIDTERIVCPIEADKVINISGLSTAPLKVEDPSGLVEIEISDDCQKVYLKAKRVGKTTLKLTRGMLSRTVFIWVKDWAGKLPKVVNAEVTGDPAMAGAVSQAVMLSIISNTDVKPGCSVYLGEFDFAPVAVPSGDSMRLMVPMGINATEDYFPVKGTVNVLINNVPIEKVEHNLLLVSNRPERVDKDGILLRYSFKKNEPTRLMYSHLNASEGKRRNLWVNLINYDEEPVKIAIGSTYAGPERSEIYVGQTSAKRFLENLSANSGYIITLGANSAIELACHDMRPEDLVSGFINFQILEGVGATVEVRTALAPSNNDGRVMPDIGAPFNPFKIHPHGVFAQPYFENDGEFTVGDEPLTFIYGESPWLIDFETGLPNTGNFGVLYKSLVELKNPTRSTRVVGLYFTPLSGPGGANFLIGNKVYQAVFRKKGDEVLVAKIELPPESSNVIEIITLPEATSCYPAQYQLREL